jgi:hypothetical protein
VVKVQTLENNRVSKFYFCTKVLVQKSATTHERVKNSLLVAKLQGSSQDISPEERAYTSTTTGTEKILDFFSMLQGRLDLMQSLKGTSVKRMLKPVPRQKRRISMPQVLADFCLSGCHLYLQN